MKRKPWEMTNPHDAIWYLCEGIGILADLARKGKR